MLFSCEEEDNQITKIEESSVISISGQLIDSNFDKEISYTEIKLISQDTFFIQRTDSLGNFSFDSIPENIYALQILTTIKRNSGYIDDFIIIDSISSDSINCKLSIPYYGRFSGNIKSYNRTNCDSVIIQFKDTSLYSFTGEDGNFEFILKPGIYNANFSKVEKGYLPIGVNFEIQNSITTQFDTTLISILDYFPMEIGNKWNCHYY